MPINIKADGAYKEMSNCQVKVNGVWKQALEVLTKVDGKWKQVWANKYEIFKDNGAQQKIYISGARAGNSIKVTNQTLYGTLYGEEYSETEESRTYDTAWIQQNIMYGTNLVAVVACKVDTDGNLLVDFYGGQSSDSDKGTNIRVTFDKIEIVQ